ncbi:MAG: hypothetical protein J5634_00825 [Bacilli bacterium]|nr:hypothetical protein [Bacilli bacterium]
MTKVKLNLDSGNIQERELITAFKYKDVKYVIFDGESTGQMGLPIILVCKEVLGKVVGITDAEEWKDTKECLKKIISGESLEYINIASELKADEIYYRQLTLPIASFDQLKNAYKAPEVTEISADAPDNTPVFEQITPEDITPNDISSINPVSADSFNNQAVENQTPQVAEVEMPPADTEVPTNVIDVPSANPQVEVSEPVTNVEVPTNSPNNYEELKNEFLKAAEELFNNLYNKINHND